MTWKWTDTFSKKKPKCFYHAVSTKLEIRQNFGENDHLGAVMVVGNIPSKMMVVTCFHTTDAI